jgi:hypothetical protein
MAQLRIRHTVQDYAAWRRTFDADPLDRKGSGVRRFRVLRSADLPNDVMVELEFETVAEARAMFARLTALWTGPRAPTLAGVDVVVAEVVDTVDLT